MIVGKTKEEIKRENEKIKNEMLLKLNDDNLGVRIEKIKRVLNLIKKILVFLSVPVLFFLVIYIVCRLFLF